MLYNITWHVLYNITYYEITKIVRALWLAETSVCMRVCKHGCGVKLFGFAKHLFAKQELITRARLRWQDFATGKNFSSNQCLTKICVFFSGKLPYKSERKLFSCVCITWYKHSCLILCYNITWHMLKHYICYIT